MMLQMYKKFAINAKNRYFFSLFFYHRATKRGAKAHQNLCAPAFFKTLPGFTCCCG